MHKMQTVAVDDPVVCHATLLCKYSWADWCPVWDRDSWRHETGAIRPSPNYLVTCYNFVLHWYIYSVLQSCEKAVLSTDLWVTLLFLSINWFNEWLAHFITFTNEPVTLYANLSLWSVASLTMCLATMSFHHCRPSLSAVPFALVSVTLSSYWDWSWTSQHICQCSSSVVTAFLTTVSHWSKSGCHVGSQR